MNVAFVAQSDDKYWYLYANQTNFLAKKWKLFSLHFINRYFLYSTNGEYKQIQKISSFQSHLNYIEAHQILHSKYTHKICIHIVAAFLPTSV